MQTLKLKNSYFGEIQGQNWGGSCPHCPAAPAPLGVGWVKPAPQTDYYFLLYCCKVNFELVSRMEFLLGIEIRQTVYVGLKL